MIPDDELLERFARHSLGRDFTPAGGGHDRYL